MLKPSFQNFKVVPIIFSKDNSGYHELFIKEHAVRGYDESKPSGRTLFVLNVPPYATEDSLKRIFSKAGQITSVYLQNNTDKEKNKSGFKICYIVFENREGLNKALQLKSLDPLSTPHNPISVGLNKWFDEYNSTIYSHQKLSEEVNNFMKNSDKKDVESKIKEKQDDDGWTVVTKKGRKPGISRKESVENKLIQKNNVKSKKKELKNFYTFQIKEQKMKNIIALRKSFQESKEKVNAMKKLRNFKPF